jgi:zinc transporter, ZIP family
VVLVSSLTALATGIGALPFYFIPEMSPMWVGISSSLAGGFMVGAGVGLLYEGIQLSEPSVAIGMIVGAAFIALTQRALAEHKDVHLGSLGGAGARRILLVMVVMTIHSFTEGVALGVSFVDETAFGLLIAVAIAIHNIPEGLAISLTMVPAGVSPSRAAGWSIVSSLPQPLMAVPAFLAVSVFEGLLPAGLGFAAGAMFWMVATQLLPDARRTAGPTLVYAVASAGAAAMLVLQFAFTAG